MKISLRHSHTLMVEDGVVSPKIDNFTNLKEILNLKGHPNNITGSRVMTILINWWIFPIGGLPCLDFLIFLFIFPLLAWRVSFTKGAKPSISKLLEYTKKIIMPRLYF